MMSSIDLALNSASTLVTMDFVRELKPGITSEGLMWTGRVVTFIFMILSALWAPQIDKFPTLWDYLQNALSFISPPIVALFVTGVFWKRANSAGAVISVIIGISLSISYLLFGNSEWMPEIHYLYFAVVLFVTCTLTVIIVSLLTKKPPERKYKELTWDLKIFSKESAELKSLPIVKNYRYQAIALIIFTVFILVIFG